jgi:hypothetical protein
LASCANGKSKHLLCHARGLELEQMGAALVNAGNQETDTVRSLAVHLSVHLGLLANHVDEGSEGDGTAIGKSVT